MKKINFCKFILGLKKKKIDFSDFSTAGNNEKKI